jgi:lipid-A-disaccharide synthase-like uncharacterized protein
VLARVDGFWSVLARGGRFGESALPCWRGLQTLSRFSPSLREQKCGYPFRAMGNFLGIEWHPWKVIGWCGNAVFFSRFIVQWLATEKKKQVVIPVAFWWLSLAGAMLLLSYSLFYHKDSVFIFAYLPTFIPYTRNIIIHYRNRAGQKNCGSCQTKAPPNANYCPKCGVGLHERAADVSAATL